MYETLLITFREGLEAFLMVAIATLYLRKTGQETLVSAVRAGLGLSVLGSLTLGIVLARIGNMSPGMEGVLALVAAAAVAWCVVHMLRMGKKMGGEISAGIGKASLLDGSKAWWSVFGFTVFMVGREGVETATMLASLAGNSELRQLAAGGALGMLIAAMVAWLWVKFGRRVNLTRFFNVTSIFMMFFAVLLIVKAFHEFTEGNLIPGIDNAYWHVATESFAEGEVASYISLLLVLAPTAWLALAHLFDSRKRAIPT